jgi:hypothetical protein
MSLKPADLTVSQYPVATRPALGFERQLYVSPQAHTVLGEIQIVTVNSGTYTPRVADNAALLAAPQELLCVLGVDADLGSTDLIVTVTGTDQNNAPLTGTATFTPPGYAQDQTRSFPKGWAAEVTATATKRFKTVNTVSFVTAADIPSTPKLLLIGVPTLDNTAAGTFRLIGTKVSLSSTRKIRSPVAIQDGADKGKYIKPGEIPVPTLSIKGKVPSEADGLARYNGKRVTGWVIEKKEDKVTTQHIFYFGLIMTAGDDVGEGEDPVMLNADSLFEEFATILAK